MRLLIAALILTLAVAVTAAIFAIWPVVADAPWEEDTPVVDRTDEIRCEQALRFRERLVIDMWGRVERGDVEAWQAWMDTAKGEVDRYC